MGHSGIFITFEGIDGSGKTTQLRRLASWLTASGRDVITTREPGGTTTGESIRAVLLDSKPGSVDPLAELLLYAADRAQHVRQLIRPALATGKIVLCDRFCDATIAYQGFGRNLPLDLIHQLNRVATDGLRPDLTLLYDLDVATGLARIGSRRTGPGPGTVQLDRLDLEPADFHQRVREGYRSLAAEPGSRFQVIPAAGPIDEVFEMTRQLALGLIASSDDSAGNPSREQDHVSSNPNWQ